MAQCIAEAAILRTETRGAHFRDDYPSTDNRNWLRHLLIRLTAEGLEMESVPVDLREITPEEVTH